MYLLGQHGVLRLGPLRVWAENGLVKVEDENTGAYSVMFWREAAERVAAISDFNGKRTRITAPNSPEAQFLRYLERDVTFVEQVANVIRQAKEQGSPDDPSARADRKRRLPLTVRGASLKDAWTLKDNKRVGAAKEFPV